MVSRMALVLFAGVLLAPSAHAQLSANRLTDSLGDPLPNGAIARLGTLRFKHNMPPAVSALYRGVGKGGFGGGIASTVTSAVFSPDGKSIASQASPLGSIRLWDAATGKDLPGPWNTYDTFKQYTAIAFSPDGSTLAACGVDRSGPGTLAITLWDITAAKERQVLAIGSKQAVPQSLAFSADGKSLVVASTLGVRWLDAATGKEQRVWQPPGLTLDVKPTVIKAKQTVRNFTYMLSPRGNHVAVHVRSYQFEDLDGGKGAPQFLVNETTGFDLATVKVRWRVKGKSDNFPMRFAFSADEKQVAITVAPDQIELRDTMTGKLLQTPPMPDDTQRTGNIIGAMALSPDSSTLAFTGPDGRVMVSNPSAAGRWRELTTRVAQPFGGSAQCLTFSPDGKALLVGAGMDLQLYDLATLKEIATSDGHRASVDHVAFSFDGQRLLTGSAQADVFPQEVATWNAGTWKRLQLSSTRPPQWPNIGVASPDHRFFTGKQGDDRLSLYDMTTGKQLGRFHLPGKVPNATAFFSPNGRFFVLGESAGNNGTRLYATPSCKLLCQLPSLPQLAFSRSEFPSLAFSADDRLVAIISMFDQNQGQIRVFDTATGKLQGTLGKSQVPDGGQVIRFANEAPGTVAFSPDGKLLACWTPSQPFIQPFLRIWDVANGKERLRLPPDGEQHGRMHLAWSPDGRMLAMGDRKIQLLEVAGGKVRREFTGHEDDIRALAFSPDGRLLASGSADTTVLIWDVWGR